MSDDINDLLEFGTIDVFYIAWSKHDVVYYLSDMTADVQHINWTKNRSNAFFFYTETEASKHARIIRNSRPGVTVVNGEIEILDEIELDFGP